METAEDKYSIKNMLFTKAMPNFVLPPTAAGHKVYGCMDCGDKFTFQSSYTYHVNRKSLSITYMCRYCNKSLVFYNRCNFLSHIRTHAFKTATINISDLKIEPLPLSFFDQNLLAKFNDPVTTTDTSADTDTIMWSNHSKTIHCTECKEPITVSGRPVIDRKRHFAQKICESQCPICMFTLPNECAFKAHLRFHFRSPPYHCPECALTVGFKNGLFAKHNCEGFMKIKSTARVSCPSNNCPVFHPSEIKKHFRDNHLVKVWKCPHCFVACFDELIINRHLKKAHNNSSKLPIIFYQCDMCPGRLVFKNQLDNHLKNHTCSNAYPCWSCNEVIKDVQSLVEHHISHHGLSSDLIKKTFDRRTYRVVKRCDKCKRNFTYKCKFEQIGKLPNECPYNCSDNLCNAVDIPLEVQLDERFIICHICKNKVSECWDEIKKHYAAFHKNYKCLDARLVLKRENLQKDISKIMKRKRKSKKRMSRTDTSEVKTMKTKSEVVSEGSGQNMCLCLICDSRFESKNLLESHLIEHRDPCMAYQCMECGKSFVVKPTFAKHLLIEHNISNTDEYIENKKCYNECALLKEQQKEPVIEEPLRENQCSICRDQFDDGDALEKHFRVHGMAFLMKNNSNKSSP